MVVRILNRFGLKGVPHSIAVLRDPAASYDGRVLAARSLANLAPAQLEALVPEIGRVELTRAEEFQCHARALRGVGGAGAAVLRRFYEDQQARVTDYVLEVLSAAGAVPDYPMLRGWLRGGTAKERADALEALEQALGRRAFARLGPLLQPDGAPLADGVSVDVTEMLEQVVTNRLGIGSAAAAMALWEHDPARARSLFARVLPQEPPAVLRDTILDLLAPPARMGPVALLHRLGEASFFRELPLAELESIARAARQRAIPSGEPLVTEGSLARDLVVIMEGSATLAPDGAKVGPGTLLGMSALMPEPRPQESVISSGCRILLVPAAAIEAAAHRSGAVASALFALREEVAHGAAA